MEIHTNSRGTAGANERCQGTRMQRMRAVCRSQCMGFSVSLLSQFIYVQTYRSRGHFHADTIGASPTVIACRMETLFKFLYLTTQRGPTLEQPRYFTEVTLIKPTYMYMVLHSPRTVEWTMAVPAVLTVMSIPSNLASMLKSLGS